MSRRLFRRLGTYMLSLASDPSPPPPQSARRPLQPPAAEFETKVRDLVEARRRQPGAASTLLAGSIELLGMDEIKRSLGPAWSAVAGRARDIAEETIREHLTSEDTIQRHGEDSFILCFGTAQKAQAKAITQTIADRIRERLEREAPRSEVKVQHTVAEVEWRTIEPKGQSIVDSIAEALKKVREEAEAAAEAWRNRLLKEATIRFGPVWNAGGRVVPIYRTLLDKNTGEHALERMRAITCNTQMKETLFELDCMLLGRAIQALHTLLDGKGRTSLLIPINFTTLQERANRDQYLKLCRAMPELYRRFLIFELHGAPVGMPAARAIEIALMLKIYSHGVVVEAPLVWGRMQDFAVNSIFGISVSARSLPQRLPEATKRLEKIVAMAKGGDLRVFMHDADTVGMVEAAVGAQVDYIEGGAVAPPSPRPKPAHRWNPGMTR